MFIIIIITAAGTTLIAAGQGTKKGEDMRER